MNTYFPRTSCKIQRYRKEDKFNANEKRIFFKYLMDSGFTLKDKVLQCVKKAKKRMTVLVLANMAATEKKRKKNWL